MDRDGERIFAKLAASAARQQYGVISRQQLARSGLGRWQLRGLFETGRLVPVLRGVFAFPGSPMSWRRSYAAAVLWYGNADRRVKGDATAEDPTARPDPAIEGAASLQTESPPVEDGDDGGIEEDVLCPPVHRVALSHRTAAVLWELQGIDDDEKVIHVLREGRKCQPCAESIRTHGTDHLPEEDVVIRKDGLRVTSALRTVVDLAPCVTDHELELAILDAIDKGLFTADQLRERVEAERKRKVHGLASLEFVLLRAGFDVATESPLEREVLQVLLDAGLKPLGQHRLLRLPGDVFVGRYDLVMKKEKVLIEVDSKRWHRAWKAKVRDLEKTDGAVELGYEVVRVRKRDLHDARRRAFLRRVRDAMATAPVRAAMKWPPSRLQPVRKQTREQKKQAA